MKGAGLIGAFMLSISMATLCSCGDVNDPRNEVRKIVAEHGIEGSLNYYQSNLSKENPKSYFGYFIFISDYGDHLKDDRYRSVDYQNSVLNCSASYGFLPASKLARELVRANKDQRSREVGECLDRAYSVEANASQAWSRCDAVKLLPPCQSTR